MRVISWILTIAALVAIVACFFREWMIFATWPLVMLAALTDKLAIEQEMRDFLAQGRSKRP